MHETQTEIGNSPTTSQNDTLPKHDAEMFFSLLDGLILNYGFGSEEAIDAMLNLYGSILKGRGWLK